MAAMTVTITTTTTATIIMKEKEGEAFNFDKNKLYTGVGGKGRVGGDGALAASGSDPKVNPQWLVCTRSFSLTPSHKYNFTSDFRQVLCSYFDVTSFEGVFSRGGFLNPFSMKKYICVYLQLKLVVDRKDNVLS